MREIYQYYVEAEVFAYHMEFNVFKEREKELFMVGNIHWKGESSWHFINSDYPLRFTTKREAQDFGALLDRLYEWAEEFIP